MVGIDVMKEKCVAILSGGLDSSVVAYWAKNRGYNVYALTFKYGQIAQKEVKHATMIAEKLGASIKIVDLNPLREIFAGVTSLCDEKIKMTSAFSQSLVVPFRNAIFLSVAVAYAISIEADVIFYGAQGSDSPFYLDCRREFYREFEKTARLGTGRKIRIEAPFSNLTKSEVITLGVQLGVPFHLTWSCYLNNEKHCGKCESCINRKNAFEDAKISDPTEYIE